MTHEAQTVFYTKKIQFSNVIIFILLFIAVCRLFNGKCSTTRRPWDTHAGSLRLPQTLSVVSSKKEDTLSFTAPRYAKNQLLSLRETRCEMKTSLLTPAFVSCFLPGTCSGFVVNIDGGKQFGVKIGSRSCGPSCSTATSAIYNARVDSSDAIAEALRISR